MVELFWDYAGLTIGSIFRYLGVGLVLAVLMLLFMPKYMALWNRRFALKPAHWLGTTLVALVCLVCMGFLGMCRGLEQVKDRLAGELRDKLENSTALDAFERTLQPAADRAVLENGAARVQAFVEKEYPIVAPLTEEYLGHWVTENAGIVATPDGLVSTLVGGVEGTFREFATSWIRSVWYLAIGTLIATQTLFLGIMGWVGYSSNLATVR